MSCVSTPTATQFSTFTTSSVSTSFSEQVTTLPDTTSTILSTSCLSSASASLPGSSAIGLGTCISSTVITSTTVIDGGVSTTQVPFEITNFVTSSIPTNTLFAPCADTTTTPITTTPTTTTTSSTESSTTLIVTPTTTFTSSQDSTLGNGAITQIIVTITSALPPTSSVSSTSVPIASTQANDDGGASSALGPIIGGTLGGFVGLLAIIGAVWFFRRRRTNWDDIFEKDYDEYSGSKPVAPKRGRLLDLEDEPFEPPVETNSEPKPYIYGLVGSKNAVSPASLDAGLAPVAPAARSSLQSHNRSSSTTPLMAYNNAPASRPGTGSTGDSHRLSPSPSFTPSAAGVRSGSPGPLGVQIPTGAMFPPSSPYSTGSDSPTSVTSPRGTLFVANQLEPITPSGTPRPGTPGYPPSAGVNANDKGSSMNNIGTPSLTVPGAVASSSTAPPLAAYAYLAERQRLGLEREDTVSSASVYSQPSRAPTPPPAKALDVQQQRRTSGVVVHTDAGLVAKTPPDQPPAYRD